MKKVNWRKHHTERIKYIVVYIAAGKMRPLERSFMRSLKLIVTELLENKMITNNIKLTNLLTFSFTHAIIDASCAAIIASSILSGKVDLRELSFYIILYNTIAFALQVPIGLIVDSIRKPAEAAVLGCFLVLVGVLAYKTAGSALIIAGLGNAFFHVGGGVTVLNLKPGKASLPGIFVAPGAIGLLIGSLIGKSQYLFPWTFIILLIVTSYIILNIKKPAMNYNSNVAEIFPKFNLVLSCILASIAIRGFLGFILTYSWKTNIFLLIAFTLAVASGKALGGILGDYFGWTRITTFGILASAPLLILGVNRPFLAILGVFLFNLTMPVTLVAISNMMPGRYGFAFGLTTLALIVGAFPTFTSLNSILCTGNGLIIFALVLLMTLILNIGLKLYFTKGKSERVNNTTIHQGTEK
jgi:hypothetical protein